MKTRLKQLAATVLLIALLIAPISAHAWDATERDLTKTIGFYDLNIPAKGIECKLTYKRHEMSMKDLLIEYDRPVLSGNLPGIDAANAALDSIYKEVRDDYFYYRKLYSSGMVSPDFDEDRWAATGGRSILLNEVVSSEPREIKTGLQYFDGRYISILFLDEAHYHDETRIFAMTFDLIRGKRVTLADLPESLDDPAGIREHLCDAVRDYLTPMFEEYPDMREDMLSDMENYLSYMSLDEAEFFLAPDGEIYLFTAAYSIYFGEEGVIPTGVYFQGDSDGPTIYSVMGDDGREIQLSDVLDDLPFEEYVLQRDSWEYDPKLSYLLVGLARASYNLPCTVLSMGSMGYADIVWNHYGDNSSDLAYCIGGKNYGGSFFVLIVVRGSYTIGNWARNFDTSIKETGYHNGLKESEKELYEAVNAYVRAIMDNKGVSPNDVTYIITGHSAGGAAGNLLAVDLRKEGVSVSSVYDYNFSCPDVACDEQENWLGNGEYINIFNIADYNDPVSYLPGLGDWGKFGHSYWFAHDWSDNSLKFGAHLMENYLDYLHEFPGIEQFRIRANPLPDVLEQALATMG